MTNMLKIFPKLTDAEKNNLRWLLTPALRNHNDAEILLKDKNKVIEHLKDWQQTHRWGVGRLVKPWVEDLIDKIEGRKPLVPQTKKEFLKKLSSSPRNPRGYGPRKNKR